MAATQPFGAPFTRLDWLWQRANPALCAFWGSKVLRYLAVLVVGAAITDIAGWVIDSTAENGRPSVTGIAKQAPVRVMLMIPWPITVVVLLVIVLSLTVAHRASRNRPYYDLLKASAASYKPARLNYRAIAAQTGTGADPPEKGGDIFDDELYTERDDATSTFTRFVNQRDRRIMVIVGRGGIGKSAFLLHRMGELSGALTGPDRPYRPHPCVFINCRSRPITKLTDLTSYIEEQLGHGIEAVLRDGVRGRHNRALVVFIDAINENISGSGRAVDGAGLDAINKSLNDFAHKYLRGEHEIYLCVTVRDTYWDEQRRMHDQATSARQELGWHAYIYDPEFAGAAERGVTASVVLEPFSDVEFVTAYHRHQQVYEITGSIRDKRTREICAIPLMLQFFCIAFRGKDMQVLDIEPDLVRDLDIFDEYAKEALERIKEQIGVLDDGILVKGETTVERAIRGLLLELALEMVKVGSLFLPDSVVFAVAQERVPEALTITHIGTIADLLNSRRSVLRAILSERIVLEHVTVGPPGLEDGGVRFVFERYFEYSIGRGLVRRWRTDGTPVNAIDDQHPGIVEEFTGRMEEHAGLSRRGFNNLRPGLAMAVLIAEQPGSLPHLHPGQQVHLRLLGELVQNPDFGWNQLACTVLQQVKPLNRGAGRRPDSHAHDVEAVLDFLDKLTMKNDFVLRWDIERVLDHASKAGEDQAVLRHLRQWMEPSATFAQRLFSGESLGFIFKERPEQRPHAVGALEALIDAGYQLDFWIVRSMMFSLAAMLEALSTAPATADNAGLAERLRRLPGRLLSRDGQWWHRSVVLAGQIERDALADLSGGGSIGWAAESSWTRLNAVLANEQACAAGRCTAATIELLRDLRGASDRYDPYLDWAVWHVLGRAIDAEATPGPVLRTAAELRTAIQDDALRVRDDPRAAWIRQPDLLVNGGQRSAVATSVALVYHPEYGHTDLHNHPESKERVLAILDHLQAVKPDADPSATLTFVSPHRFTDWQDDLLVTLQVHDEGWIQRVKEVSHRLATGQHSDVVLEGDTEVRAGSYEGALLAVRGALCAVEVVLSTDVRLAVALVRPPGHLAGNKICIFNNIAVATRYAQRCLGDGARRPRVLIVDCDAHHGKNTQDVFWTDETVLYFSIHQAGVHPGTGKFDEQGDGQGKGYTVNVPIPAFSGDRVYAEVLDRILRPILDGFQPELIMISMGLDAYHHDNFSQLELSEWSYWRLATTLQEYRERHGLHASPVACLEGGYDLASMGPCVQQFTDVLGGRTPSAGNAPTQRRPSAASRLDRHLLAKDAGDEPPGLSESDEEWLNDVEQLEGELHQRW